LEKSMNFSLRMFMLIGGAYIAVQPIAVEAGDRPPPAARRLLMACMTRQMAASRTISYNEASAICKAQLQPKTGQPALASAGPP
jgi:hypothetical protein